MQKLVDKKSLTTRLTDPYEGISFMAAYAGTRFTAAYAGTRFTDAYAGTRFMAAYAGTRFTDAYAGFGALGPAGGELFGAHSRPIWGHLYSGPIGPIWCPFLCLFGTPGTHLGGRVGPIGPIGPCQALPSIALGQILRAAVWLLARKAVDHACSPYPPRHHIDHLPERCQMGLLFPLKLQ